jgi:hypothetical protein
MEAEGVTLNSKFETADSLGRRSRNRSFLTADYADCTDYLGAESSQDSRIIARSMPTSFAAIIFGSCVICGLPLIFGFQN